MQTHKVERHPMQLQTLANVFENHNLSTIIIDGKPWWIAREVAVALRYEDPGRISRELTRTWRNDLEEGVDYLKIEGVELSQLKEALTLVSKSGISDFISPRSPSAILLSESGINLVCMLSKQPLGKALRRWLAEKVLPSIARTGSYTEKPMFDRQLACIMAAADRVKSVPGVDPAFCEAQVITLLADLSGRSLEPLRKALPCPAEPIASLNATAVGQRLGISAQAANRELASRGLQRKNSRKEWELTEAGKEYGAAFPYSNKHSGYQVLWRDSVVDAVARD